MTESFANQPWLTMMTFAPLVGALESLNADPRGQTLHTGPVPDTALR